jgi:glycosyltransferase involved in cell wall biosynthesis
MAIRKVGLIIFSHDESWIGGSYYVMNLIRALSLLPDEKKPVLHILSNSSDFGSIKKTNYPYLKPFVEQDCLEALSYGKRVLNKLSWTMMKRDLFFKKIVGFDFIFPVSWITNLRIDLTKVIYWIPDFQEKYYPNYFDQSELTRRSDFQNYVSRSGTRLVLSSQDAFADFKKHYPKYKCQVHILPFAVTHEPNEPVSGHKYESKTFYYCANQFWQHKNHKLLFEAVLRVKRTNPDVLLLLTGNTKDPRNAQYFEDLLRFIDQNDLKSNVIILGFVPRREQYFLYKNCLAFIQPSKFEGWNTSIEDCKYFNTFVIASDLAVHKEQLVENACFFGVDSVDELATAISYYLEKVPLVKKVNYVTQTESYATNFSKMIEN